MRSEGPGRTTPLRRITDWRSLVLRVIGAGLLVATGAIHLDLYLTGYRTIPTIGWLFLLQIITAFGLGLIVLPLRGRLAAAAGAGFAVATLGGYLLSLRVGLFGFREVRTSAGIVAGVIEVAAFAALASSALGPIGPRRVATPATVGTERPTASTSCPSGRAMGDRGPLRSSRRPAGPFSGRHRTCLHRDRFFRRGPRAGQRQRGVRTDECPWVHLVPVRS